MKVPTRKLKKDHPPSVATSEAYKEYEDGIKKQKQQEKEERKKKKEQKMLKKELKGREIMKKKINRFLKKRKNTNTF